MKTIQEFCASNGACKEGRDWAIANCKDMNEVWQTASPHWLRWVALRSGVLTTKELRLFAIWSARQVQHLMPDKRSIKALDVAELHANGKATDDELAAAADGAYEAADCPVSYAPRAAYAAAVGAIRAAADAAAYAVIVVSEHDAAREAQAQWLRENTNPNFA
jgi:hypothetical protein